MDRSNIEKIARTDEDRYLLAMLWDKINGGMRKNIISAAGFLSPREQEMAQYLFGNTEGLYSFGGYEGAERRMWVFLPDYLGEDALYDNELSPVVCIRAVFYQNDEPCHRDFLGALMGCGIDRRCVGDICVGKGKCDFFVTREIAPYVLQNFISAGRTKLSLSQIPLAEADLPLPEVKELKDTLASLRLDAVVSAGFRVGRSQGAQYVESGKTSVNGLPEIKPDRQLPEGAKIAVRGLGKIVLKSVNGTTKKGRVSVLIDRYI